MSFYDKLDDRQRKEVHFALMYKDDFSHGTDGHNRLLLIARLVELLREYETPAEAVNEASDGDLLTVAKPAAHDASKPFSNLRKPQGFA